MKKIFIIHSCLLFMFLIQIQAQTPVDFQNKKFVNHIHPVSKQGWVEFRNDAPYNARELFKQQPALFNMQPDDEMRIWKTNTDAAGNKHYKFVQYYKGVRVEGIEHITHERNGRLHLANGNFVSDLNLDVTPAISANQSVSIVLTAYPAEKYLWQDVQEEARFKAKKKDENASLYPAPELLIIQKNPRDGMTAGNYILAYRMYIFAEKPHIAIAVYVDAETGEIIREKPMELFCSDATISTTYNGTQTVKTDFRTDECDYSYDEETEYFSINDCDPDSEIKSYYSASYGAYNYGDDWLLCSSDNTWASTGSTLMVMTSLWAVSEAFNYFMNEHGHESFDGSSGLIDVFSNKTYFDDDDDPNCSNANFTNFIDNIYFGAGSDCTAGNTDDYNSLDIAGHEYTHGVIEYAHYDALDYSEESGALNESFADIFGEIVEHTVEGGDIAWLIGEDLTTGPFRSFISPNDEGDPDTYLGTNWYSVSGSDDNGGVHTNSSVQNHMFYLLSEGGSGVNDFDIEYNVEGIGWSAARDIAWQAMMNYLNAADGYFTARNAWIQAAIDLYGSCSQQVISVGQAWQAVGVTKFTGYDVASVCGTYTYFGYSDATYGIENSTLLLDEFVADCNTTINSTANVAFESGYYIQLNPGFEAISGCIFISLIDECVISEYDPDDLRSTNEASVDNMMYNAASPVTVYPSPADDQAQLEISLQEEAVTNIMVYNLAGNEVMQIINNRMLDAGKHVLQFDVSDVPSGVYVCIVTTDTIRQTCKFSVQH